MASGVIRRFVEAVLDRASAKRTQDELSQSLAQAGQRGGENFLRELRAAFDRRLADLKVQLSQGLIDVKQFKAQSEAAAQQFNVGLLQGMEAARRAGTLTEREYVKLSRQLKRTGDDGVSTWSRIKGAILSAAGALGAFIGLRQLGHFLTSSIREANEAQAVWNRLGGILDTVGIRFADVEREVTRAAQAMQRATTVSDEDFAAILTELISVSGDYAGSLRNVQLVADFAAAKQIDFLTAAKLVGRAMIGETGTLSRYGVVVKEGADAIEVMRQKFAGMAENEAKTLAGQTKILANAWGEFKEEIGRALSTTTNGTSVIQRLTEIVISLTKNLDELVATGVALGKALLVGGAVLGLTRLVTAIRAVTAATTAWMAVQRGALALMGPKGWFVLGVAALAEVFRRVGKDARDAARATREAMDEFKEAAAGATDDELAKMEQDLRARALAAAKVLEEARKKAERPRPGQPITAEEVRAMQAALQEVRKAEKEVQAVNAAGAALVEERARRQRLANQLIIEGGDADDEAAKAAKLQLETFLERQDAIETEIDALRRLAGVHGEGAKAVEALNRQLELEGAARQAAKGLTDEQAQELARLLRLREEERARLAAIEEAEARAANLRDMARQIEILGRRAEAIRQGEAAVEALNRELFIEEAVLRSGAEAASAYAEEVARVAGALYDAERAAEKAAEGLEESAEEGADPWIRVLRLIQREIGDTQSFVDALASSWAEGSLGAIVTWAKGKVKENLAAAIEEIAQGIGALARGNPGQAGGHFASAAKHRLAATAWAAIGGGGGGGGGSGGGGGRAAAPPADITRRIVVPRPEQRESGPPVHFTVIGANDPAAQQQVSRIMRNAVRRGLRGD